MGGGLTFKLTRIVADFTLPGSVGNVDHSVKDWHTVIHTARQISKGQVPSIKLSIINHYGAVVLNTLICLLEEYQALPFVDAFSLQQTDEIYAKANKAPVLSRLTQC